MVGPQRSDQGNGRPLRRSRFHRAGARSLPGPGDAGARRGQPHDGRAGLGRGDRGRNPRRVPEAQGKLRQGRRDGVLPGRRAHRHCLRENPRMRRRHLILRHSAQGAGRPGQHRGAVPGPFRERRLVVHAGARCGAGEHHEGFGDAGGDLSLRRRARLLPTSRTTPTTRRLPPSPGNGRWRSSARISEAAQIRVRSGGRAPRRPSSRRRMWRSRRRRSRRPPPPNGRRSRPRS